MNGTASIVHYSRLPSVSGLERASRDAKKPECEETENCQSQNLQIALVPFVMIQLSIERPVAMRRQRVLVDKRQSLMLWRQNACPFMVAGFSNGSGYS